MGMLLNRGRVPDKPAPAPKPDFIRYEEHTQIVTDLTREYELKILALQGGNAPEPEAKRKPGRPRKA